MAYFNEFPENESQDKPKMQETTKKGDSGATSSWNEQAASRTDRTLSAQEIAERKKVEGMPGSIGRGFDRVPTEQNVRDWYDKLPAADKKALNDPNHGIILTCTASRTGDSDYNVRLSRKSGEATERILKEKLGVKAKIEIQPLGYLLSMNEGDDRFNRQVFVDFVPPEKIEIKEPTVIEIDPNKDLTEPPKKPKGYDHEKEIKDRLKDIPDILKGKFVKQILKEIGKLAKTYLEGVGELKEANKRAAELTGIENALKVTTQDWLHGRGPHINEGKPYTPQELKDRMYPADKRKMADDMTWCKIGNKAADKDLDRGFKIAADAINQVLRQATTPEARQTVLRGFAETVLPRIARNRQSRLKEIKGKK